MMIPTLTGGVGVGYRPKSDGKLSPDTETLYFFSQPVWLMLLKAGHAAESVFRRDGRGNK